MRATNLFAAAVLSFLAVAAFHIVLLLIFEGGGSRWERGIETLLTFSHYRLGRFGGFLFYGSWFALFCAIVATEARRRRGE